MPIKPWSISTTVRNPERLRGFLGVLAQMEGEKWDRSAQTEFQIRLVQRRLYGFGHCGLQFYAAMPRCEAIALQLTPVVPYSTAKRMFASAGFKNAPLRGRRLFSPLQWCGFADIRNGRVFVTDFGRVLLAEERNYGNIVLQVLANWQIPNPLENAKFPASRGYDIRPFIGFLRLILEVNRLSKLSGMEPKGVSFDEVGIFALTMIDRRNVEKTARELLSFRQRVRNVLSRDWKKFVGRQARALRPEFDLVRMEDKMRDTLQYFRLTGMIQFEDDGFDANVNVPPFRQPEIAALAAKNNAALARFRSTEEYKAFLGKSATAGMNLL